MTTPAIIALVTLIVTLLVQFGGIIWFAASQRNITNTLTGIVAELRTGVQAIDKIANGLDKRVTVLEDREERRSGVEDRRVSV